MYHHNLWPPAFTAYLFLLKAFMCTYHRLELQLSLFSKVAAKSCLLTCLLIFLQPLVMPLLRPGQGGGKVKPGAQGGAPVGQHLVLFLDLSGKPDCSLQKPHILAELQHRERIGKGHVSEEGSRGLANTLKAIFSCRSFVSDLRPASK